MVECCSNPSLSWVNQEAFFDNVFHGYLSLFQVVSPIVKLQLNLEQYIHRYRIQSIR